MKVELLDKGFTIIAIPDAIEEEDFHRIAQMIQNVLGAEFINEVNDYDSIYLHFLIDGIEIILHFNNFLGTEIYSGKGKKSGVLDDKKIMWLAEELKKISLSI